MSLFVQTYNIHCYFRNQNWNISFRLINVLTHTTISGKIWFVEVQHNYNILHLKSIPVLKVLDEITSQVLCIQEINYASLWLWQLYSADAEMKNVTHDLESLAIKENELLIIDSENFRTKNSTFYFIFSYVSKLL